MALDQSGRFVHIETIQGKKGKILIDQIIKGEHYVHGKTEFYSFRIAREDTIEFLIDYPEVMKYPQTLRQILSGRNIITHKFIPDLVYNDIRVSYEETVKAYYKKKQLGSPETNDDQNISASEDQNKV